jgi:hypothetical protein
MQQDQQYSNATVVLIEIAEYIRVGQMLVPEALCGMLNCVVSAFERGLQTYRVEGVGFFNGIFTALATRDGTHADDAARFALYCIGQVDSVPVNSARLRHGTVPVCAAIHTGPVTSIHMFGRTALLGETIASAMQMLQEYGAVGRLVCSGAAAVAIGDLGIYKVEDWAVGSTSSSVRAIRISPTHASRGLLGGACLVCPDTAAVTNYVAPFLSPCTQDVAGLFGFMDNELRHLRMLYGPDTDTAAIASAMQRAKETIQGTEIKGVVLYTRSCMARKCSLLFEFAPSTLLLAMSCLCEDS